MYYTYFVTQRRSLACPRDANCIFDVRAFVALRADAAVAASLCLTASPATATAVSGKSSTCVTAAALESHLLRLLLFFHTLPPPPMAFARYVTSVAYGSVDTNIWSWHLLSQRCQCLVHAKLDRDICHVAKTTWHIVFDWCCQIHTSLIQLATLFPFWPYSKADEKGHQC